MKVFMVTMAGGRDLVGSALGRRVSRKIQDHLTQSPTELSFEGAGVIDATFLREAMVRLVKMESPQREIVVSGLVEPDHLDNLTYVCLSLGQPVTVVNGGIFKCHGKALSRPLQDALDLILNRKSLTSTQLAAASGGTVQCASTNLKNIHRMGYVNRVKIHSESGGMECIYSPFGASLVH